MIPLMMREKAAIRIIVIKTYLRDTKHMAQKSMIDMNMMKQNQQVVKRQKKVFVKD